MYLPSMQDVLFSANINEMKHCFKIVSNTIATMHHHQKKYSTSAIPSPGRGEKNKIAI